MISGEMPAAVIRRYAFPPEYVLWPMPHREHGQALVRVTAAPISPLDLLCASGTSYFGPPRLPYIPGVQGIGIVMEADKLVPGQRIWFSCDAGMKPGDGSMALYCVIDESSALELPMRSTMTWPLRSGCPRLLHGWPLPGVVTSSLVSKCLSWAQAARLDR